MGLFHGAWCAFQIATASTAPSPVTGLAELLARARVARFQQDSLLSEYRATVKQRMSSSIGVAPGLGLGPVGRLRLAARYESVARVGWHHALGAWGELIGSRAVVPIVGEVKPMAADDETALVLPYYPGRDRLWPTSELSDALPSAGHWIEHPLDPGADSLYVFSLGDSLRLALPNKQLVRVRELRVRPRRPSSRLIVGSLWLDVSSGSIVRAAYRPSVPMDLWPFMAHDIGHADQDKVKKFGPFTGNIQEIIVENGLYDGQFWLPRTRVANAEGTAKGARVTLTIEQGFTYEQVSALKPNVTRIAAAEEEVSIDPRTGRVRRPEWRGAGNWNSRCRERDDSTAARWSPDSLLHDKGLRVMRSEGVRFRVLMPCHIGDLATSPTLPPSIYGSGEELFPESDMLALRKDVDEALNMSSQAKWSPQKPTVRYGIDDGLLRYNRVEGLSAGISVGRVLGNGYTEGVMARLGSADLVPNGELFLQRSNLRNDVRATAYRRLDSANDWGSPLGLGASATALLFGRDNGMYYRTLGAELTGVHRRTESNSAIAWRLFAERQDSATVATQIALVHTFSHARFLPNISAQEGMYAGAATTLSFAHGLDPRGVQVSGSVRLEAAGGEFTFARGMTEWRLAKGLSDGVAASVVAATGYTAGTVPVQRQWYLGGAHTVHAYNAGTASGNAFWMVRAELAKGSPLVRPLIFADMGWAGDRRTFTSSEPRLAAAGVGVSTLDGLLRFDVSRSLQGTPRWRADFYLEVR